MSLITNKKKIKLEESVFRTLQNGKMPSVFDIKKWIKKDEATYPSNLPAKFSSFYANGNSMDPSVINKFIDEYSYDMKAIQQTIEDGWAELDLIINKAITFSEVYDKSLVLSKSIRASLSKIDDADEFYSIRTIGTGISASDWDLSISNNINMDQQAGAITIAKNSNEFINKRSLSVASDRLYSENNEVKITIGETFGSLDNIFDSNIASRYIRYSYSNEVDARVSLELMISVADDVANNIVSEINLYSYAMNEMEVVAYTSYDGSNFSKFGEFRGNGKFILNGSPVNTKLIKLIITKTKSDGQVNGKIAYIFDIGEIDIIRSSYNEDGYCISNAIENDSDIVSASVTFDGTNESNIKFWMANDVDGAKSKDDFSWYRIYNNMNWISQPTPESQVIQVAKASKYFYGPGSTFDIYEIGKTDGILLYAEEGYNQVEVRYKTVTYADTVPTRLDFSYSTANKYVSGTGDINLKSVDSTTPNYFFISTKIYSDFNTSLDFNVNIPFAKHKIYINAREVGSVVKSGSISLPISAGENTLEIAVLVNNGEASFLSLAPKTAAKIAINKMEISTQDSMASTSPRACVHDGNIIVNKNSAGKSYRIYTSTPTSKINKSIRLMAELTQDDYGKVPTIRQIVLRTGF